MLPENIQKKYTNAQREVDSMAENAKFYNNGELIVFQRMLGELCKTYQYLVNPADKQSMMPPEMLKAFSDISDVLKTAAKMPPETAGSIDELQQFVAEGLRDKMRDNTREYLQEVPSDVSPEKVAVKGKPRALKHIGKA